MMMSAGSSPRDLKLMCTEFAIQSGSMALSSSSAMAPKTHACDVWFVLRNFALTVDVFR